MPELQRSPWKRRDVPLRVARPPVQRQHASGDPGVQGGGNRAGEGGAVGRDVPASPARAGGRMSDDRSRVGCLLVSLGTLAVWLLIALAAWLIAVESPAQTVCCGPSGRLWDCADPTCRGPLGWACVPTGQVVPAGSCAAAPTPTPTVPPTPTATPTPAVTPTPTTPPPPALPITLAQLPYLPFALTYHYQVPWIQRQPDGSTTISSNAGHDPGGPLTPAAYGQLSTHPQECKVVVYFPADGGTPQSHITYCTGQTRTDWETGDYVIPAQTNPAELWGWGTYTSRPVGPIGGDTDRDVQLERITLPTMPGVPTALSPFPARTTILSTKGVNYSLLGIVDLSGQQMAYIGELVKQGSWPYLLRRYRITQYGGLDSDPSFVPIPIAQVAGGGAGPLNLTLAHDGRSLLTTDPVWPQTMACHLWQSSDQGQTWSAAGVEIPAPAGSVGIAQCGIAVGPGGQALSPMWGICQTFWSQDGDDGLDWSKTGDWRPYVWYQQGAALPPNLLTPAAAYPPATPTPAAVRAQALAAPAPHVEPRWLPGAIQQPQHQAPTGAEGNTAMNAISPPVASTATISGHCYTTTPRGKAGLAGVTISLGLVTARTCLTAFDGAYTTQPVPAGTYAVTPRLAGYKFTPTTVKVSVAGLAVTAVNFTAEKI